MSNSQIPTSTSLTRQATKSIKCSHLAEGSKGRTEPHSGDWISEIKETPSKILYDTEHLWWQSVINLNPGYDFLDYKALQAQLVVPIYA